MEKAKEEIASMRLRKNVALLTVLRGEETKTASGIIIPEQELTTAGNKPTMGLVEKISHGFDPDGLFDPPLKVGDKVQFKPDFYRPEILPISRQTVFMLSAEQISGIHG
jgi:co-chaperonin GroES (HSP10)